MTKKSKSPKSSIASRSPRSPRALKNQKGGVYSTDPTPAVRSFRFVKQDQPYPLEGAPAFPPDFLKDDSCTLL